MLIVTLLALDSPELSFELVNGHINAPIGILARFGADENLAVLGFGNDFHARIATLAAIYDHLDPIDAVVVFGKLGRLLLRVPSDSFGYFDMFTGDCE
jgi:hypothetical protein